jgi:hypothetical protein
MSKKFISIILGVFILAGAAFFLVLRWGSELPFIQNIRQSAYQNPPPRPPVPSVGLSLERSGKGNILHVTWANLPANTKALRIYRSLKGKSDWVLWKTIGVAPDNLANGDIGIDIGNADYTKYDFYVEAVGGGGGASTSTEDQVVLWTSSSTDTGTPTSTQDDQGNGNPPPGGGQQNSSGTGGNDQQQPPPAPNSTSSGGGNGGIPYYSPKVQISGYGSEQSGNFWVQHIDQKIQIGWQNLPPETTNLAIFRSPNQDGPWNAVLTQGNPGVNGSYSIQIVDDTLGQPYYYKMDALAGSTTIATYGPVYLPPVGQ